MKPATSLKQHDFADYPPEARRLAMESLETLRPLPLLFVATLLLQISRYDWLFPPERKEILDQLELLRQQGTGTLCEAAAGFDQIRLNAALEAMEWAAQPERFSETLTAYLWSSRQMDTFRMVALSYTVRLEALRPQPTVHEPRICIILMGQDARADGIPLFERLRPKGTLFENVSTADAFQTASEILERRAGTKPGPYQHWWIDGGEASGGSDSVTLSYAALRPVRQRVLEMMEDARTAGAGGPEGLRSTLHELVRQQPEERKGLSDPLLDRFALEIFADGSGTQIYSTTFVQWTAREVLRRAQPSTIVLRYSPRQWERPLSELIVEDMQAATLDPQGSLIDADMGSYYTWLNLMRLPGAERDTLIACHEGGSQAIAVSPSMAAQTVSRQACNLQQILNWAS